ncbi:hypothetical protein CEXT_346541, partial [Caerostris extrusa]
MLQSRTPFGKRFPGMFIWGLAQPGGTPQ